jgi:hypothetical protein
MRMSQGEDDRGPAAEVAADRELWRRSRAIDVPEDAVARLLDFAAFAEGRLDAEESERVAALLAADPAAAADIEAARVLGGVMDGAAVPVERVIGRALPLVAEPPEHRVIAFAGALRRPPLWNIAQWASLAAAITLASWFGFAMGSDTFLAYRDAGQTVSESSNSYLPGLLDTSTGFVHDIAEELQS